MNGLDVTELDPAERFLSVCGFCFTSAARDELLSLKKDGQTHKMCLLMETLDCFVCVCGSG